MSLDTGFTPLRRSHIEVDVPEYTLRLPSWMYRRRGAEIARTPVPGAAADENIYMVPGGWWLMKPHSQSDILTIPVRDLGGEFDAEDVNSSSSLLLSKMWKPPTGDGLGLSQVLATQGLNAWIKQKAASSGWDVLLSADQSSYPGPNTNPRIPIDRVWSTTTSLVENQGFTVIIQSPVGMDTPAEFFRVYWGGASPVLPLGEQGGEFCLSLDANGEARLYERTNELDPDPWKQVFGFEWGAHGKTASGHVVLQVIPHWRYHIAFRTATAPKIFSNADFRSTRTGTLYSEQLDNEHRHMGAICYPGPLRVDIRRDYRQPWAVYRHTYPETCRLSDGPFSLPTLHVDNATPMQLDLEAWNLANTGWTGVIKDATTHATLTTNTNGHFIPNPAQTRYYVQITGTSDPDQVRSPALVGYIVRCVGTIYFRASPYTYEQRITLPTEVLGYEVQAQSIDPSTDRAKATVRWNYRDPFEITGKTLLGTRDQMRCRIEVLNPSNGALQSVLFEGISSHPQTSLPHPVNTPMGRHFEMQFAGMWGRLAEQVPYGSGVISFLQDLNAPLDVEGNRIPQPWQIVDIIRYLLNECGFPDDELDLRTDLYGGITLSPSPASHPDDYMLMPGGSQTYSRMIQRMTRDYLGAVLVFDPNAGVRGMWRLLPNPNPTIANPSPLCTFHLIRPIGAIGTALGSYGASDSWIEEQSYLEWPEAPEFNYLYVCGIGAVDPTGKPTHRAEAEYYNYISHEFRVGQPIAVNPNHPDYIGHFKPVYYIDPGLYGQEAVNLVAAQLVKTLGRARRWARWRAPLMLVTNASDASQVRPRPLRINDEVNINPGDGNPVQQMILRSVTINPTEHDTVQMATYEGVFKG